MFRFHIYFSASFAFYFLVSDIYIYIDFVYLLINVLYKNLTKRHS